MALFNGVYSNYARGLLIPSLWLHCLCVSSLNWFIIQIHLSHLHSKHGKHGFVQTACHPGQVTLPSRSLAKVLILAASLPGSSCKQSVISLSPSLQTSARVHNTFNVRGPLFNITIQINKLLISGSPDQRFAILTPELFFSHPVFLTGSPPWVW